MRTSLSNDFQTASREVLDYLHKQLGFHLWMVTRVESDDWIVLSANDHGYNVESGQIFKWTDSFCSRMVEGNGPRIAPCSDSIPAYATAPIGKQVSIGAYVGVPLEREDGSLFGTLCAIDPEPVSDQIIDQLPMVEMMAMLLTKILENELKAQEHHRKAERAMTDAITDQLTGLYNRRGWDQLLAAESDRCRRYGHPVCMFSIDVDDLKKVNDTEGHARGDELIQLAAKVLDETTRKSDIVARLGGDEFGILAVECNNLGAVSLKRRLLENFKSAGVSASIGMSMWNLSQDFLDSFKEADANMYKSKHARRLNGGPPRQKHSRTFLR
ncbi:sensor domain-containing diguanylate cyclase [Mariniblastus fucicola]|uniref:diguanylate cyclase n=1 Tax=Mariniblastus fucicola TaxID=980251 RepID=A0A5B9P7K1_9BACT|nr:sensor domain-containing diguanylate cyclase [Mariniblastus fucicola]QEG20930.1 putative diguanylate cyclase AdrA [Mariniblastus fucicola]